MGSSEELGLLCPTTGVGENMAIPDSARADEPSGRVIIFFSWMEQTLIGLLDSMVYDSNRCTRNGPKGLSWLRVQRSCKISTERARSVDGAGVENFPEMHCSAANKGDDSASICYMAFNFAESYP
jgi:hypothetical protein